MHDRSSSSSPPDRSHLSPNLATRVHWVTVAVPQGVMTLELVLLILERQWLNV